MTLSVLVLMLCNRVHAFEEDKGTRRRRWMKAMSFVKVVTILCAMLSYMVTYYHTLCKC